MAPILPLIIAGALGAYFLMRPKPVTPVPNGGGGGGVIPTGTGQSFRTLTLDEVHALFPDASGMLDAAPPPHGLTNGDTIVLFATASTPDKVVAIPGRVTVQDKDAAIGYVTVVATDASHNGIAFRLDTRANEDAAYLWDSATDSAAVGQWLAAHGFAPAGVNV